MLSGLFVPLELLPPLWRGVAQLLPVTHAVALLQGVLSGGGWGGHLSNVAALIFTFAICTLIAARVFRWE